MSILDEDIIQVTDLEKIANVGYPTQEQKNDLLQRYPHNARYMNITEISRLCADKNWPCRLKYENREWFKVADCPIMETDSNWNMHIKGIVVAIAYKNIKVKQGNDFPPLPLFWSPPYSRPRKTKCKNYGFGWTLNIGILYGVKGTALSQDTVPIPRKFFDPTYDTYSDAVHKSFEIFEYFKEHPKKLAILYKIGMAELKLKKEIKTPLKTINELTDLLNNL